MRESALGWIAILLFGAIIAASFLWKVGGWWQDRLAVVALIGVGYCFLWILGKVFD